MNAYDTEAGYYGRIEGKLNEILMLVRKLLAPDAPKGEEPACPICGCDNANGHYKAGVAAPDPATEMDNPRRGYELWQQAHAAGLTATDPMWSAYWAGYQQARAATPASDGDK